MIDTRDAGRRRDEVESEPEVDAVKVEASPARCPYCHTHVDAATQAWVACAGCLARHHDACWGERGACATCGDHRRLVSEERHAPSDDDVIALLRAGKREQAVSALRLRGLDERQARVASELALRALDTAGPRDAALGLGMWMFAVQAVFLAPCAIAAGAAGAELGALCGLAVIVLCSLGLAAGVALARGRARWLLAALTAGNLGTLVFGPIVVSSLYVPAREGSAALAVLGLLLATGSLMAALFLRWWRRNAEV